MMHTGGTVLAETEPSPVKADVAAAQAAAAVTARTTYENFSVLSPLVPADLRPDFAAVYAFCRAADDAGDEYDLPPSPAPDDFAQARARATEKLIRLRTALHAAMTDAAPPPDDLRFLVALSDTIRRRALPLEPFDALIDAFLQDQVVTRYQSWDQLVDYCRRSADPVGRIVLMLGGFRPPEVDPDNADRYRLSDLTCTALQLTNFWQDVRRDLLERDRVYLPLAETGLSAETLRDFMARPEDPAARIAYIRALRPLVDRTREMFIAAGTLPSSLDRRIGPVVGLLASGGRHVLELIERTGCTTLWHRPRLSKPARAMLVLRAIASKHLPGARYGAGS